ncbi:MAG: hypothetical protein P8N02_11420 [Actinomycetota bacterium]|nr:hypothetical protein [Actinomycetota bacterium]
MIDETEADRVRDLEPEERDELIQRRANRSQGLAHAMVRFLADEGIDVEAGGVRESLAAFLADSGVELVEGEDGEIPLRKLFTEYLATKGIDVENGRLREALIDNGYGPTPEEVADRLEELEKRRAERRAHCEENKQKRADEREGRAEERCGERVPGVRPDGMEP